MGDWGQPLAIGKQASKQARKQACKQASKQVSKKTSKQSCKHPNKQANMQASKEADERRKSPNLELANLRSATGSLKLQLPIFKWGKQKIHKFTKITHIDHINTWHFEQTWHCQSVFDQNDRPSPPTKYWAKTAAVKILQTICQKYCPCPLFVGSVCETEAKYQW